MPDSITIVEQALNGARGNDQMRIAKVGLDWLAKILRKNADYGSSVWKRPIIAPDMPVSAAIRCRMSDKISRLIQLIEKGQGEVSDESFDDTLEDLAAYGLLYRARPKEESQDAGHSADSKMPADCQGPGHKRF